MNIRLDAVCKIIGADCSPEFSDMTFRGVASLDEANPDDITFLANPKYERHLASTRARVVIVSADTVVPPTLVPLRVRDPYFAFLTILHLFNTRSSRMIADNRDERASVHPTAVIGANVSLGPCAVIGERVTVGDNTVIGPCSVILSGSVVGKDCVFSPNVTIMDGCTVGDRVILHAGVVIGSDGFGFAPQDGKYHKIPQIGTVSIGNDVEIGANSCIDRAAFGVTIVRDGTKIDNLVQVAHNVRIGSHTVIASQVGISGSTSIGNWVRMGGQAGLAGHIAVGDGATVGAQAGVTKDVPAGETVSGYPAKNHMHAMRLEAALRYLPDLMKKVKEQERRIAELEKRIKERS
jgi:UDP-3-O-[3-hydroxymyristoyl] glucosamine N-acyltransferase